MDTAVKRDPRHLRLSWNASLKPDESEGCSLISVKSHSGISTRPLPSALGPKHWLCHAGLVPKELVDTQRPAVSSGYPVSGKWLPSGWPESAGSKGPLPTERKPQ